MHRPGLRRNHDKTQGAARQAQTSALAALRAATVGPHAALEAALPLMAEGLTFATYARHLQKIEPLVAQLEAHVAQVAPTLLALDYDYALRRRHHLLVADLRQLSERGVVSAGLSPPAWPLHPGVDAHHSVPARLGLLYVLEGSTLGGQLLRRHLSHHLGVMRTEVRYFAGHGRHTGILWRQTCALLERGLATPAQRDEACRAAVDTFAWFHRICASS